MSAPGDYRVELDEFSGPLDLLLYLVRKEEISVEALPIARLTEQYLRYIDERIDRLDLDRAADYLVMAAQLLEWKARSLLPSPPPDATGEEVAAREDARAQLVRELLEYRELKERARLLAEKAEERAKRFERESERRVEEGGTLKHADLWDLVTAFQRLEKAIGRIADPAVIEADDTPLAAYVERLEARLAAAAAPVRFADLFGEARTRPQLVATFLALLELVRLGRARARHEAGPFSDIWIERG